MRYSTKKSDIKTNVKELTLYRTKPIAIIGIVAFVLALYFLVVYYCFFNDYEAMLMGYSSLMLAFVAFAICVGLYLNFKGVLEKNFELHAVDGEIYHTIEKEKDGIKITRISDGEIFTFNLSEVAKIKVLKTIVVITLDSKKFFCLPAQENIIKMFDK